MIQPKCANAENVLHLLHAAQKVAATSCCSNADNLHNLEEGISKILSYVAKLERKIDNLGVELKKINCKCSEKKIKACRSVEMDITCEEEKFKKIYDPDELIDFEKKLTIDMEFRAKTVSKDKLYSKNNN